MCTIVLKLQLNYYHILWTGTGVAPAETPDAGNGVVPTSVRLILSDLDISKHFTSMLSAYKCPANQKWSDICRHFYSNVKCLQVSSSFQLTWDICRHFTSMLSAYKCPANQKWSDICLHFYSNVKCLQVSSSFQLTWDICRHFTSMLSA